MDNNTKIFTFFSTFWIILCWIGFLLTLFDFFYVHFFTSYLALGIILLLYFFFFKKNKASLNIDLKIILAIAIIFSIFFAYFTTPTIFSGRDQGSISEASIRLSQNHQLEFSTPASEEFFQIHGPGRALNFPGFHYTEEGKLTTQFPLVYTSWLAIFYSIFGLIGFKIANSILFIIFLGSFYLLTKKITQSKISHLLSIVFITTSFCFSWFFKFTLTENMALALIFFGILQFIEFTDSKNKFIPLMLSCTSLSLMIPTRIEGIAVFFMFVLLLLLQKKSRTILLKNKLITSLSSAAILLIFTLNLIKDLSFFKEMGKALIKTDLASATKEINILIAFLLYGIIIFLILGSISITRLLIKKEYTKLLPLLITLPTFIYLLNPQISSDHPWMLRRFTFSVLPILILYSVILLDKLYTKNKITLANSIVAIILLSTLPSFASFATFSESKNLLKKTETISKNFSDNDLVLIDQQATGSGWTMLSGPMNFIYNKNSVYFFNINDLNEINKDRFNNIYIIIPDKNIQDYSA
ncbi:hypothetical protein ACFL2R_04100, partial [Patescibacteria group bacterium]